MILPPLSLAVCALKFPECLTSILGKLKISYTKQNRPNPALHDLGVTIQEAARLEYYYRRICNRVWLMSYLKYMY